MKIESHLENLKESVREIELAVKMGLLEKQRTIGFHTSAGAIDMLEIILHKFNLIDPGFVIKHEWFNSVRLASEKLPFDFSQKKIILSLVMEIEGFRNTFCYGKRQEESSLEKAVLCFHRLREIFQEVTQYEL